MRADSLFTPLQGGSASEAVTRSPGRAGVATDGMDAFAGLLSQAKISETRPTTGIRPERPGTAAQSDTLNVPEGNLAADDGASAKMIGLEDGTGPQILPHNPPVISKEGTGPQILPHNPPVTDAEVGKEGTDPQILPGEDGKVRSDDGPQILPHNPPVIEGKAVTGPQILPGEQPAPGRVKGTHLPQVNPGPSPQPPAAVEDGEAETTPGPATATSQGAAKALTDGQAAAPLAPALVRRLLATHEGRESTASRGSEGSDLGSRLKARLTGDAAPAALQAVSATAPAPVQPPHPTLSMALAGQPGQMTAERAPAPSLPAGMDTPNQLPAGDTAAVDPFKTALASADRSLGLSTLSRATVETTALIAAQIQNRLNGRSTRFEMALTPEGLGRVDVSIEIDSDGRMAARLAFDNPAAATELRGRADELRRQLEQAGLHLDGDALQFTERDPSSRDRGFSGFDRRAFARASDLNDQADQPTIEPATWHSLSLTRDRVDLKV